MRMSAARPSAPASVIPFVASSAGPVRRQTFAERALRPSSATRTSMSRAASLLRSAIRQPFRGLSRCRLSRSRRRRRRCSQPAWCRRTARREASHRRSDAPRTPPPPHRRTANKTCPGARSPCPRCCARRGSLSPRPAAICLPRPPWKLIPLPPRAARVEHEIGSPQRRGQRIAHARLAAAIAAVRFRHAECDAVRARCRHDDAQALLNPRIAGNANWQSSHRAIPEALPRSSGR